MTAKAAAIVTSSVEFRSATVLRWALAPVALAGMGVSAYLSFVHFTGLPLYCEGAGGCHAVQSSEYATLLGVPISVLGLALFGAILASALLTILRVGAVGDVAPFAAFGLALSGLLYSGYLTWLEFYRIYAVCVWCVASASLLAALFVISGAELVVSGRLREREAPLD